MTLLADLFVRVIVGYIALLGFSLAVCGLWRAIRWWWNTIVFPPTGYVPKRYRVVPRCNCLPTEDFHQ